MQKEKLSPEKKESPGFSASERPQPQGAPRGLLHFYTLLSIGRRPMRGYDIMKDIEMKTEGAWRPGPGAVYPVLQKLMKQGFINAKAKSKGNPPQVVYEITPSGLENIANAKKMMKSSSQRWNIMRQLFIDLMEPDDLVKFAINSMEMQMDLVHTLVESEKSTLSSQDRLFILRQYKLNLERELSRTAGLVREINRRSPRAAALKAE
ncbi:MAG: PadR family transcriptional regulator [Nitrososphaerota archaeon]|nr:PadR family transcriptional regulator [Nitrososphaerota archaeon]MDG6922042.1 PadR family transcriptional regulator [Nitrososphaerota archaeon]